MQKKTTEINSILYWARIFKCYWGPGIDSKEWIPPAYLACTATAIPFIYLFSGNCAASAPISTFMCLWAIYIFPGSVHIFPPAEKADPSSLTDTWMWKLGLIPQYSFSGNICLKFSVSKFQFSVFCLCSVAGRYDNPIPPRFLAPIDFLKIPALIAFRVPFCEIYCSHGSKFWEGLLHYVLCRKKSSFKNRVF